MRPGRTYQWYCVMLAARGYTLVSIMVGLTLSALLLTGALQWARHTLLLHQHLLLTMRMENELARLLQLITTELRRAGYDAQAAARLLNQQPRSDSPFVPALAVNSYPGEVAHSCILFHYDKNQNGRLDGHAPAEQLGFRLHDGTVEYRVDGRLCHHSGWHDLTSKSVLTITDLQFSATASQPGAGAMNIVISAHAAGLPENTRTHQRNVMIRNY